MANFSVTCRMLSQYLKEKRGSVGGLEMAPRRPLTDRHQTELVTLFRTPAKTMSLFPGVDVSREIQEESAGDDADHGGVQPEAMNLFPQHAGFGSDPAVLAAKEESAADTTTTTTPETKDRPDATTSKKGQLTILYDGRVLVWDDFPADKARDLMHRARTVDDNTTAITHGKHSAANIASDMPIARRNSLHRFLEKRKDRISTKTPYQIHGGSSNVAKPELSKFW